MITCRSTSDVSTGAQKAYLKPRSILPTRASQPDPAGKKPSRLAPSSMR